jgi:hypothetical protein
MLAILVGGCAPARDAGLEQGEHASTPIVGGATASDYPESVLIEMSQQGVFTSSCSGAVVAPRVVLTAGHCVDPFTGWRVQAPFVNQSSTASKGETFDWKSDGSGKTDAKLHDVGLVYLDRPITLPRYPALAAGPVADGSPIVNIGRVGDSGVSSSTLFVSKALAVTKAGSVGFPYDYVGMEAIAPGDSGGPVEVPGTTPHLLVAVNSGVGGGIEVLARTDLLASWIGARIAGHGGAGEEPPAASAPTPTGKCAANEAEPNDDFTAPNTLGASVCGTLGGGDRQDWYTWSTDGPAPYDLRLVTSGDARISMWTRDALYEPVDNASAVEIAETASGAGSYVVVVYTYGEAAQSYTLTLTK